jgi:hypothetical protein
MNGGRIAMSAREWDRLKVTESNRASLLFVATSRMMATWRRGMSKTRRGEPRPAAAAGLTALLLNM